ncbi:MAG: carboxymuconolactone decarboxylase family protein [Archaeoglobaceae archaeon]
MENQVELKKDIDKYFEKYLERMPQMGETYYELSTGAYKEGELSTKTKRLMAVAVAVASSCRGCILSQTEHALDQGATVEEIFEACGVAISMGGTMAAAETTRLVQYLQEKGKLQQQ